MSPTLPSKATLTDIEKEARQLLHDLRLGSPAALKALYLLDSEARTPQVRLTDAQYIIARKYGHRSWQEVRRLLP